MPSTPDQRSPSAAKERAPIWTLCCNCGAITLEQTWTYWQRTEEGDWRRSEDGEGDPMCKCPSCGWEHIDDDSNPGYYNGTREEMYAEHARIVGDWLDHWLDRFPDPVCVCAEINTRHCPVHGQGVPAALSGLSPDVMAALAAYESSVQALLRHAPLHWQDYRDPFELGSEIHKARRIGQAALDFISEVVS